jgi:ribosomal-protein-alanine N-acetyltransferase
VSQPFILRFMTLHDLPQVAQIDRMSFPIPWSPRTYEFEINENDNSQMLVLSRPTPPPAQPQPPPSIGLRRRLHRLLGTSSPAAADLVVGLGGFWCAVEEAHISTMAVHPGWRGRGLGEVLLAGMIARGIALGAREAALEVRVSNEVAQNLYRKYEFQVIARHPHYYRDNREDALLMQIANLDAAYQVRLARRRRVLGRRVPFVDLVNGTA